MLFGFSIGGPYDELHFITEGIETSLAWLLYLLARVKFQFFV